MCESGHRTSHKSPTVEYFANSSIRGFESPIRLRATVKKLHSGAFGNLGWVEKRSLGNGAGAFDDLLHGRTAAPKIVLCP